MEKVMHFSKTARCQMSIIDLDFLLSKYQAESKMGGFTLATPYHSWEWQTYQNG